MMVRESSFRCGRFLLSSFAILFAFPGGRAAHLAAEETSSGIAPHPSRLEYPDLEFNPPERDAHRNVLPCGVPVYVVEDTSLPLIDLTVLVRCGAYLEPSGKEGIAELTGSLLRSGGTEKISPEDFDEELAYLAANVSSSIGATEGSASFNCLSKDIGRVLELFIEMIRTPRFDPSRVDLKQSQELQDLSRRNDETSTIESREWERLLRGADFFTTDRVTKASIEAIGREDLSAFHRRCFHPRNFIIAVSGDVRKADILARLDALLAPWVREDGGPAIPPVPRPTFKAPPGVYVTDKPSVNQGRVSIGHPSTTRDDPEYHALFVMNHILGGGGFTSRIMSRVRSDEGLAYSAGSRFEFGVYFEGLFRASFQSKSESVVKAAAIVIDEIDKMRSKEALQEEVATAVQYAIGSFPRMFATPHAVASTLAADELTGRDPSFWRDYRRKMKAVTPAGVHKAAQKHLRPSDLVILIVGNREEILKDAGTLEKAAAKASIPSEPKTIPLPDPLTLEYPEPK